MICGGQGPWQVLVSAPQEGLGQEISPAYWCRLYAYLQATVAWVVMALVVVLAEGSVVPRLVVVVAREVACAPKLGTTRAVLMWAWMELWAWLEVV